MDDELPPVREIATDSLAKERAKRSRIDLLIVAKDRPMLYETFRRMSAGETDIEIRVDRRHRKGQPPAASPERRRLDIGEALRTTGWAVVPATRRSASIADAA